jgi:uncharacterized protein
MTPKLSPLLLIALVTPAAAQPLPAQPLPSSTLLTVAAEGRAERAPDVADLSAGVVTQAATASEALRLNAGRMTTVIAALKRAGIAGRDIQTSGLNLNPQYLYRENQPPQLTGYQVVNNVSVRVRDLDNMGRTIDALVAQGANQINGPSFRLDKPDAALDEARVAALAKARQRAELYARAAGMSVRRIAAISETSAMTPPPYPVPVMRAESMAAKDAATPIAPGEVEASITVNVTFELQ